MIIKTNHYMKNLNCIFVAAMLVLTSCTTAYKMTYLQDMAYNTEYPAKPAPELLVQKGDKLDIQILSATPELAAPFQLASSTTTEGRKAVDHYTVDSEGQIDFPVLGTLKVEGMTLKEVQDAVAQRISDGGYIKSPSVRVHLANFAITVVGSAGNTVIPVEDSSINLLQVIARSGGTSGNANIKEVTVIRTEDGVRTAHKVDLHSKDLFDSPVFYLQQGDVVYVKPRGAQMSSSGQVAMTFVGTGLTLISIITNFLLWSNR